MTRQNLKVLLQYIWVITGIFLVSNGIVLVVQSRLGAAPWDVLHLGISNQAGISMGRVVQGVGLLLVLLSWLFHVKPTVVTIINMFFVGFFIDTVTALRYLPLPQSIWLQYVSFLLGVAVFGLGTAFYLSANGGSGPRDSVMLVLTKLTPLRLGVVRTLLEVAAAGGGYLLGGPLGIGTILFALLVGLFVELGFSVINILKSTGPVKALWL